MAKKPTSTLPASSDEDLPSSLAILAGEGDLLMAVSGGPDSMALLHLGALWRASLPGPARPKIFAASVDHGLRPGARAEAELAGALAKELGIPHVILDWQVGAEGKVTSRIQERARAARYELLAAHAAKLGARAIVTGHHGDDQAQTLLFRLLRGSSPAGLAGMRKRSVRQGQAGLAGHAGHAGHADHVGHAGYVILRPLL
ncbi:MAG: tRNA lysidine(34) synthetase TilS, partial [Alphaproteobacteria bacterium]|nr:tRNA lysidine(34) synthetase TilS [Alphaproteobacteria bacterium]